MILTCNSAVASLMLSPFLYFEDMNDIDKSQTSDITFNNDLQKLLITSRNKTVLLVI